MKRLHQFTVGEQPYNETSLSLVDRNGSMVTYILTEDHVFALRNRLTGRTKSLPSLCNKPWLRKARKRAS